ncbi:hypothetical protein [Rariglobus hedericola]|uniref:Verru_Chthon cassette protein A n=1 Tax=Rariglobus hedericola TaxID=2597822 RepID=A0A556QJU9_9BACT|nr:hypothetical protein [Rariglobus hedericola]TSJ76933.1 hypothetical protein FPL22_12510 [Rariglobus hedericola]
MNRIPSNSVARRERGFALLITITLLAFLVLLLVSLASLTRVETQVASNNQQLSQARQNALMALNIAVGQLQKYAGPDQRTTARADLENTPGQNNSQWVGVYGSSVAGDYTATPESIATALTSPTNIMVDTTNAADPRRNTGSPARLLNWLVSGNEITPFDPRRTSGDVGALGQITTAPAAASIPYKPAGTVANLTETTAALATNLTITNASNVTRPARLLVGQNSVTSSLNGSQPIDYVVAPAVDITVPAASVPGMGSGSPVTVGRYAWWVGDEGVKARVNLPLAGTDISLTNDEKFEQQRNAFSNSTRAAIELMASDTPSWTASMPALNSPRIDTLYSPDAATLAPIVSPKQVPLASTNAPAMSTALKYRFHDVTTQSTSVLADTNAGGLKRDLSILLDPSYTPAATDPTADLNRMWVPHSGDNGGFVASGGFAIPTWRHLRSFAQTRVPTASSDPNALSVPVRLPTYDKPNKTTVPADADHVGAAPVITYFSLGFRAAPVATPAPGVEIHMNLYPLVVIWNPYNVTLRAPAAQADGSNFEVGVQPSHDGQVNVELEADIAGTWTSRGRFNFLRTHYGNNGNFIRFRLKCPDILPGQSLVFSLPVTSSGQVYNQQNILENIEPEPGAYVSVPFRTGPAGSPTNITILAGEENLSYRLAASPGTQSASFLGGGGINIYLGEPSSLSSLTTTGGANDAANRAFFNPSATNRRWYSTAQDMDWSGLVVTPPFQEPGPLVHDTIASEPTYVFQTQALFSGQGSNAQLNANQYMFATRWLAQGNMRAVRSGRTRRDNNYNVLFTATAGQPLYTFPWQKFINGPGPDSDRTSAGQGHDWLGGAPVDVGLFEFPYENQPLQSIGQLQHANLSLVGAYPAYPVGNSLADFRLVSGGASFSTTPPGWQIARVDSGTGAQGIGKLGSDMRGYYDISYLLNRNLWDRYYFSTVPATGAISATQTFPNTRHLRYNPAIDVQNPDRSAAGLMVAGAFNINSTSEQAWRAILGGGNQLRFNPENPGSPSTNTLKTTFSRFIRPNGDDNPNDAWKGYRSLDENEIAQLARDIVTEIRNRGPFVSLGDFVNRRLVDNSGTPGEDESYRGTIQAAIDATTTSSSTRFPTNDAGDTFWAQDQLITSSGTRVNQESQYTMGYYGRPLVEGRRNTSTTAERPYGGRSSFAPKYITQADILSKIGAGLSGRSDTFTIRTYGETVNPVLPDTDPNYITGRAWCEAVVQRLPEYVESSVNAWDSPGNGSVSQTFGRKFKIISFRWLSPNDI